MIIVMYIYHVLINAVSAHMIHINPNTIYICRAQTYQNDLHKILYGEKKTCTHTHAFMHTHALMHTRTHTRTYTRDCSRNWVLILVGAEYCEKRKVFNIALKDDRVEPCLSVAIIIRKR